MKKMKFNRLAGRTIAAGFVLGLFMAAQSAAACTLQNWSAAVGLDETDASQGTIAPGAPNPAASDEVLSPRYSGRCAMAASGQGYVEDVSPGGITRIVARFYVLANNSADAIVYEGLDGTSRVFDVTVATDGTVTLSSGSQNISTAGNAGKWNSIEIDWTSGGDLSLIVNGGTAETGAGAAAGTLDSVRLGNINSAAGSLNFDAYESRRSTAVGRLCEGETTGDGKRTSDDFLEIFDEVASAGGVLSSGQPDFTEDGFITNDDVLGVFDLVAGAAGACP